MLDLKVSTALAAGGSATEQNPNIDPGILFQQPWRLVGLRLSMLTMVHLLKFQQPWRLVGLRLLHGLLLL